MNYGCDFLAINSQRDSPFCKYEIYNKIIFPKNADAYVVLWLRLTEKGYNIYQNKKAMKILYKSKTCSFQ